MANAEAVPSPGYLGASLGTFEKQQGSFETPSLVPTLFNITLSLTFVVTLIYVVNWFLRRWKAGQGAVGTGESAQGLIRVLEKSWIDPKHGLAVVEMGGEIYFLGLGDEVSVLGRIQDAAAVASIKESAPSPGGLLNFQQQLEKVGIHLRRDQWKRSKDDLKRNAEELGQQIERLKPSRKKESE